MSAGMFDPLPSGNGKFCLPACGNGGSLCRRPTGRRHRRRDNQNSGRQPGGGNTAMPRAECSGACTGSTPLTVAKRPAR